ncbi:MAG: proline--tRNA ligase [Patescibacteria group bacterium]
MPCTNKKATNLSAWYLEVVQRAQLADYGPAKGTMIIRPNGYAIWENVMRTFDPMIVAMGARNAYFPLLFPMSFLQREKEHVEGFSPELAVVTIGGGEQLGDPLAVRPTSETVIHDAFSRWISSWRDLPMKVNQWCNVVRWEKRTFPFLRTSEFLWQEGHTAHATEGEAAAQVREARTAYERFCREVLALPVLVGRKTESQKFAGAVYTESCEALMPDGKALQSATSHQLGQNFSKADAFNISFQTTEKAKREFVWQTSWGMSTRIVGAIIMVHGDDRGLVLPPRIAPIHAVVVPIYKTDEDKASVLEAVAGIEKHLHGVCAVHVDRREEVTPGFKFNDWEMQGAPVRIEVGPKDVAAGQVVVVRRDTAAKEAVAVKNLAKMVEKTLVDMQVTLYQRAEQFLVDSTVSASTYADLKEAIHKQHKLVRAAWCGEVTCEEKIKEDTKATARVIPDDQPKKVGQCVVCGKPGTHEVLWARAY